MTDPGDTLSFIDDTAPVPTCERRSSWKVLIVDDEEEVHTVTRLALNGFRFAGRPLQLISAYSGEQARAALEREGDIAVVLLDVVMETDQAGLDVIRHIRAALKDRFVRIILRTGQPGQAPERDVIMDFDINDYKEKTELTAQKLFTVVYTALGSYRDLTALDANRRGLEKVVEASETLFELHSLEQFAQGVLEQLAALLYLEENSLYARSSGIAATENGGQLQILAATGRYRECVGTDARRILDQQARERLDACLRERRSHVDSSYYIGYFRTDSGADNVLYMCGDIPISVPERRLVDLFCRNVSIALDNLLAEENRESAHSDTVALLCDAIEARGLNAQPRARRIAACARVLARAAGMDGAEIDLVAGAAPLHDIGKVAIPEDILNKPGPHTPEERAVMMNHAAHGYTLLANQTRPVLQAAAIMAHEHHERWDGKGYPQGLARTGIHLYGRIAALIDVCDALSHARCYAPAWDWSDVVTYVRAGRGTQFDPALADLLLANGEELEAIHQG